MFKKFSFLFVAFFAVLSLALTSCGDDDDDLLSGSGIIGTWEVSYDDYDDGFITETYTFRNNGTVVNTFKSTQYPEDNYSVTANYSIAGDLESGAILRVWGKSVDGEDVDIEVFVQLINDNTLLMRQDGDDLFLHRK